MNSARSGGQEAAAARPAAGGSEIRPAGLQASEPAAGVPAHDLQPARPWTARLAWWAPALLAAAAMAVAGLWGLARGSAMGNDEIATRWAAMLGLRDLARLLRNIDAVHGLYYLIMHGWVIFGSSPAVLRIPSVIAMVVAAGLTAALARKLTGSGWAALVTGLIMAVTPTITYYAQTARSYAMVLACVVAATLVLVHALDAEERPGPARGARRWWIGYVILVVLASYLNEMALLMLAAHAVTVLLARRGRRVFRRWLGAAVLSVILVVPLLALSSTESRAINWILPPGPADLKMLFHDYFGAHVIAPLLVLACVVVAVLPGRGALPVTRDGQQAQDGPAGEGPQSGGPKSWWRSGGISVASVALPLLVLPAGLLLAESRVAHPFYVDRYVLYGEAGAALLAGAGALRIGRWAAGRLRLASPATRRAVIWLPGALLVVLALIVQLGPEAYVRTPAIRTYNFGGPAQLVGVQARPGDGVLYFGTFFRKTELGYPEDFTQVTDFAEATTPRQAGDFQGTDKRFAAILPLMLQHPRIWVIGVRPSPSLPPGLLRQESNALAEHFTRTRVRHYRGVWVTLWQRR